MTVLICINLYALIIREDVFYLFSPKSRTPQAKETVERLGILYKGPMETPKGSGVKSINVTARKVWSVSYATSLLP
jgi:isocitrate dehydrogenase